MGIPGTDGSARATGIERAALAVFYLFTAVSVLGFAVFGRDPEFVMRLPDAAPVYAQAVTFFPRAHVVLAFAVLALLLVRRAGARWVTARGSGATNVAPRTTIAAGERAGRATVSARAPGRTSPARQRSQCPIAVAGARSCAMA